MSKVMPLPTSTTCGALALAGRRGVVEADQPRRGGRGLADADDAAEALRLRAAARPSTVMPRPACCGDRTACSASHCGFLMLEGTVARVRARQPAMATASPRWRTSAGEASPAGEHDPAYRPRLGSAGAQVEVEGAEHGALDERAQAGVVADGRHRGGDGVGSLVRRASAAPARRRSFGVPAPTPTSSTSRRSLLARLLAPAHGQLGHLARLAGRAGVLEHREQVELELGRAARRHPGPRVTPSALPSAPAGEHGQGQHLGPAHACRWHLAERELGRGHLGRESRDGHGPDPIHSRGAGPRRGPPGRPWTHPGVFGGRGAGVSRRRP